MKLQRLNRALERANNQWIYAGFRDDNTRARTLNHAGKIEDVLLKFVAKAAAINANENLTVKGKAAELRLAQGMAKGDLHVLDDRIKLAAELTRLQAETINAVVKAKGRTISGEPLGSSDPIVRLNATLQAQEIRAHWKQARQDAREEHINMLAQAEKEGILLSDQQKAFRDPLAAAYLAACETFTPQARSFIDAIENAPWSLRLLDDDVLVQGEELLKRAVAGDFIRAAEANAAESTAIEHLLEAAVEVLESPASNPPFQGDYILQPDNSVKLPASAGPPSND